MKALNEGKEMSNESDLGKAINWDMIPEKFTKAFIKITDKTIRVQYKTELLESYDDSFTEIKRPREFEDGAAYPVVIDKAKMIYYFHADLNKFWSDGNFFERSKFSFIGQKLPDSLWSDEPKKWVAEKDELFTCTGDGVVTYNSNKEIRAKLDAVIPMKNGDKIKLTVTQE